MGLCCWGYMSSIPISPKASDAGFAISINAASSLHFFQMEPRCMSSAADGGMTWYNCVEKWS